MELEDHVPVYIPELDIPEDLVPAEDGGRLYLYYHHSVLSHQQAIFRADTTASEEATTYYALDPSLRLERVLLLLLVDVLLREFRVYSRHTIPKDRAAMRAENEHSFTVLETDCACTWHDQAADWTLLVRRSGVSRPLEAEEHGVDTLEDTGSSS
ncbi:hypothetical protein Tco_1458000 [Tanacetum coccineum]